MASSFWKQVLFSFDVILELSRYIWDKLVYRGGIKAEDERDISNSIVVVTGANSGIGKELSYKFAIRKATVIMACRNLKEGNMAIKEHEKKAVDSGISFPLRMVLMHLDLLDFSTVRNFCQKLKSEYPKIDILINNAGVFDTSGKIKRTESGIELHMAVNYLSQFLMTNLLLDGLKVENYLDSTGNISPTACRIINVSSTLQLFGKLADENNLLLAKTPESMGLQNSFPYGLSKFYISLYTKELSRRVSQNEALVYSLCPGYVNTGIFRSFRRCRKLAAHIVIFLIGISPSAGCDTILYLALSKIPPPTGVFYRFTKPHTKFEKMIQRNKAFGQKLWECSEKAVELPQ